ncbi:hypothetical protein PG996_002623 [Apiospora saccharicola]|uniref:Protein kinase domain-containing protein n=1 Tax=Apiospora saccharicola TaxID=335842 RepID=A0ABR1WLE8_9PEZI
MAHRKDEHHTFQGLYLPWSPDDGYVPPMTTGGNTEDLKAEGFTLIGFLAPGVCVVQSIANGQLYVNELIIIGLSTNFNKPPAFRYSNGGTLRTLLDLHHRYQKPVPEPFIWHVIEVLSEAFNFMYRGRGKGDDLPPADVGPYPTVPPWRTRVYHRNLTLDSIYINYENCGGGPISAAGQIRNAFPTLRIGNWEDSAIDGDTQPLLPPGRFGQDPAEWHDVYGFGQIIRSLMLAHVPMWTANNCPNPNWQLNEYTGGWNHRPDSRQILTLRGGQGNPYSGQLYDVAASFEVDNIQQLGIAALVPPQAQAQAAAPYQVTPNPMRGTATQFPGNTVRNVAAVAQGAAPLHHADVNYIVNLLRPLANGSMRLERRGGQADGYYDSIDVSWTKPTTMPLQLPSGSNMPPGMLQGADPAALFEPAVAQQIRSLSGGGMGLRPAAQVRTFNMSGVKEPPA